MTPLSHEDFDPVTLEILCSRLISTTDESAAALLRTSFSTIVRESNDYATVLMDANGDALAENTAGIPSFVGILPRTLRDHLLARYPRETWRPGDCVITNDPWMATGHLPDITMAAPIFYRGRLVAFSGSIAHSPDIGGSLWAADCRELYEEGLLIPPIKFLVEGRPNQDVVDFISGNVRMPEQVLGDLQAQVSAQQVCAAAWSSSSTTRRWSTWRPCPGRSTPAPRPRCAGRSRRCRMASTATPCAPTGSTRTRRRSSAAW